MKLLVTLALAALSVAVVAAHGHVAEHGYGGKVVGGKVYGGHGGGHKGGHAEEEYVKHKIVQGPIGHDVHVYGPHQGHVSVIGGSEGSSLVVGPQTGDVGVVGPSAWGVSNGEVGHGVEIGHGGYGHGGEGYGHGHAVEKKW